MTKTEMIEAIRKACIKANPQIVKLERGCYVRAAKHSSPIQIDGDYALDIQNKELRTLRFCDNCPETQKFKIIEIIGRDIGASDILKILPEGWQLKYDHGMKRAEFVLDLVFKIPYFVWIGENIHDQSEETIRFIYSLLQNDNQRNNSKGN